MSSILRAGVVSIHHMSLNYVPVLRMSLNYVSVLCMPLDYVSVLRMPRVPDMVHHVPTKMLY